jgi:hypothetical protein
VDKEKSEEGKTQFKRTSLASKNSILGPIGSDSGLMENWVGFGLAKRVYARWPARPAVG